MLQKLPRPNLTHLASRLTKVNLDRFAVRIPKTTYVLQLWQWIPLLLISLIAGILPSKFAVLILGAMIAIPIGLVILAEPLIGLALVLLFGPLGAWEEIFVGGIIGSQTSGQLLLFTTIASWGLKGLKNGRIVLTWHRLMIPILIYTCMISVTLWHAEVNQPGFKEVVKWLEILLMLWIFFEGTAKYPPKKVLYGLIGILMLPAVWQGIWGVWHFILRGTGPGHFIIGGRLYRATGSFQQPNPFGGYMAMNFFLALGILIGLLSQEVDLTRPNPRKIYTTIKESRWIQLSFAITMLLGTALVGSWSRGAWIGAMGGVMVVFYLIERNWLHGVRNIIGILLAAFLAVKLGIIPRTFTNRLFGFIDYLGMPVMDLPFTPDTFSIVERLVHWESGLRMWREHPWFGVGMGNYEYFYERYQFYSWNEALGHAHNYYINLLAEVGYWGLIGYAIMWGSIFLMTYRVIQKAAPFERGIALGLFGAWTSLSIHHYLDNLYVKNIYLQLGMLFAVLILIHQTIEVNEDER